LFVNVDLRWRTQQETTIYEGNRYEDCKRDDESNVFFVPRWRIGYGKVFDNWQLFVREYAVYEDERGWCHKSPCRFCQHPPNIRIAAADFIPELLARIEEEVKKKIARVLKKG